MHVRIHACMRVWHVWRECMREHMFVCMCVCVCAWLLHHLGMIILLRISDIPLGIRIHCYYC